MVRGGGGDVLAEVWRGKGGVLWGENGSGVLCVFCINGFMSVCLLHTVLNKKGRNR